MSQPSTLCDAVLQLPDSEEGFRFLGSDEGEDFIGFGRLREIALDRAGKIAALGLGRGDRVVLAIADQRDFATTFLGCVLLGAVPVPVSSFAALRGPQNLLETLKHIVGQSQAGAVLCSSPLLEILASLETNAGPRCRVVCVEDLPDGAGPAELPRIRPDDLCFLQFTSGSTQQPRGVAVSHRNLVANSEAYMGPRGIGIEPGDHAVSWLPLYHDYGLSGFFLGPVIRPTPTTYIPTTSFLRRPTVWLEALHRYRGTVSAAPNFAFSLLVRRLRDADPTRWDLSRVRALSCGGEPIQHEVLAEFTRRLRPAGLHEECLAPSYGLAETTLAVSMHTPGTPMVTDFVFSRGLRKGVAEPAPAHDPRASAYVSCGTGFDGHELAICDPEGRRLPDRRVGEIRVRGPSVCSMYFRDPEATREVWREDWLCTGDLGYKVDGRLFVCGRIKDVIIVHGVNHHAHDIEWTVSRVEGVRSGGVAAFATELPSGEELVVVAESKRIDDSGRNALRSDIAATIFNEVGIAAHDVVIVSPGSVHKTTSGKVRRSRVRRAYEAGSLGVRVV